MTYCNVTKQQASKPLLVTTIALLVMLLLSACNGNAQAQQRANQNKTELDTVLSHAQRIGLSTTLLQPILQQEAQLRATSAPMTIFTDQPVTDYYTNLAQRYQMLAIQARGLESQTTQQLDYQASLDLQTFEGVLAQRQGQGFVEAKTFANQFAQDQKALSVAQYPKDYLQISGDAKRSTTALRLLGPAYDNLVSLQQTIKQLQASHLDVTALNQQEEYDVQLLRSATRPEDFAQIIDQVNTQLQETTALSTQAIPYVGAAKLKQYSADINVMKQYGQDVTSFQKRLAADQAGLDNAKSFGDYLKISAQIDSDVTSIQVPMIQGQANYLLQQFHQEVNNWGNSHQYHDPSDGNAYILDYEYDQQHGYGSDADAAVQSAQTIDDYQAAIDLIKGDMLHLKAMEADYNDKTSWDQPHASDIQLMQHYNVITGQVMVVSLIEQTLRLYQGGKLLKADLITTGQYDKPSPPGFWHIFDRESPTKFKSSEPKGSAFWYPDTKINFAMEYHDGGYFFHDSWWRVDYGPGTNFPHYDSGGDESFAGNGSHGCINMQEDQANWMYNNTGYGTAVIVY